MPKDNKIYVPNRPSWGIGKIVSQTWDKGKLKEVRVYFEKLNNIVSIDPKDVRILNEEDN